MSNNSNNNRNDSNSKHDLMLSRATLSCRRRNVQHRQQPSFSSSVNDSLRRMNMNRQSRQTLLQQGLAVVDSHIVTDYSTVAPAHTRLRRSTRDILNDAILIADEFENTCLSISDREDDTIIRDNESSSDDADSDASSHADT